MNGLQVVRASPLAAEGEIRGEMFAIFALIMLFMTSFLSFPIFDAKGTNSLWP